jgi:hypothetical protein
VTDNPNMPFAEIAEKNHGNPAPHRPFDQLDIRLGAAALAKEMALGGKLDTFATVKKIFDAAGVISSRATPRPANVKKRKEMEDAQPSTL